MQFLVYASYLVYIPRTAKGSQQHYENYSYFTEEAEITMLFQSLSVGLQKSRYLNEHNLLFPIYPYLCTIIALCSLYAYSALAII